MHNFGIDLKESIIKSKILSTRSVLKTTLETEWKVSRIWKHNKSNSNWLTIENGSSRTKNESPIKTSNTEKQIRTGFKQVIRDTERLIKNSLPISINSTEKPIKSVLSNRNQK